jgi:hypothetical protein
MTGELSVLQTGDYVVIEQDVDDVRAGHVCRVLGPDESSIFHRYGAEEWVPVLCWTGYVAWTTQDNLIEVSGDGSRLDRFFQLALLNEGTRPV